jgi:hypothetical protein
LLLLLALLHMWQSRQADTAVLLYVPLSNAGLLGCLLSPRMNATAGSGLLGTLPHRR